MHGERLWSGVDLYLRSDFQCRDGCTAFFLPLTARQQKVLKRRRFIYVKVRTPPGERGLKILSSTLWHELSHAYVHQEVGTRNIPLWVNEGFACTVASTLEGYQPLYFSRSRTPFPLHGMCRRSFWRTPRSTAVKYGTSELAVSILVARFGWGKTFDFIREFRLPDGKAKRRSLKRRGEDALRKIYGIGYARLQEWADQSARFVNRGAVTFLPKAASVDCAVEDRENRIALLKYDQTVDHTPKVVAAGCRLDYALIRRWCLREGVPLVVRPKLAGLLTKVRDEDLPSSLYRPVAEVLSRLYVLGACRNKGDEFTSLPSR